MESVGSLFVQEMVPLVWFDFCLFMSRPVPASKESKKLHMKYKLSEHLQYESVNPEAGHLFVNGQDILVNHWLTVCWTKMSIVLFIICSCLQPLCITSVLSCCKQAALRLLFGRPHLLIESAVKAIGTRIRNKAYIKMYGSTNQPGLPGLYNKPPLMQLPALYFSVNASLVLRNMENGIEIVQTYLGWDDKYGFIQG